MEKREALGSFLVCIFGLVLSGQVLSTSLGLGTGTPLVSASSAFLDYFEFGEDGDLSTFGAAIDESTGISQVGVSELDFGIGFLVSDPTAGPTGGFSIYDENGFFLGGNLVAIGFSNDLIELEFGNLTGAAAGDFGTTVLASVNFTQTMGANPFASLVDGEIYTASITIAKVVDAAPVPSPTIFSLIVSGLLGLGMFRKVRYS